MFLDMSWSRYRKKVAWIKCGAVCCKKIPTVNGGGVVKCSWSSLFSRQFNCLWCLKLKWSYAVLVNELLFCSFYRKIYRVFFSWYLFIWQTFWQWAMLLVTLLFKLVIFSPSDFGPLVSLNLLPWSCFITSWNINFYLHQSMGNGWKLIFPFLLSTYVPQNIELSLLIKYFPLA